MHGVLAPYRELDTFPLPHFWNTALTPARVAAKPLALFLAVEALARCHGHADVLDAWGSDIELIRAAAKRAGSEPVEEARAAPKTH
jgi:hypothetical protein